MIAVAKPPKAKEKIDDSAFEQMLPTIQRQAKHAFRHVRPELKEDLICEVVANSFLAYRRLVERDKADLAYPSVLARFAIKQARQGRKVGSKMNVRDTSSYYCRRKNCIKRHGLGNDHDHDQERSKSWPEEILVEDRHATPADIACCRVDFNQWLMTLDRRQRRIAKTLATNETTQRTARKFNLSEGRISQIRRELERAWHLFQDELPKTFAKSEPALAAINRSLVPVGEAV